MADSPIEQMRSPEMIRHHRRVFRTERTGWVLMLLFIVAALLGLFGSGPLSYGRATSPDGALEVTFERFLRQDAPTSIEVQLDAGSDGPTAVLLDTDYLSTFTLEGIQPRPEHVIPHGDEIEFVFPAPDDASAVSVTFQLRANTFGSRSTKVQIPNAAEVTIRQFIYP